MVLNMKIIVSGSIETGQNFSTYVEEGFKKEITKYFENISTAEVHLKKQGNLIYCSVVVNNIFAKGDKISADAENLDARKSFDESLKKLFFQLKTEKNKALAKKKKGE